jgi:hypothetical protein
VTPTGPDRTPPRTRAGAALGGAAADLVFGARVLAGVPRLVRRPVRPQVARATLARRFETRAATFLDLVTRAVYARPDSPYARLFQHAGCQRGDLERLVRADGVEGALRALLAAGVYLTVEELKGRRPAVRGSTVLDVDPGRLANPLVRPDLPVQSGGSGGPATPVGWALEFVRDRAVDLCLAEAARGPAPRRYAIWAIPGTGALVHLLDLGARGAVPARWFSPAPPGELAARYRWSTRVARWAARLGGGRVPRPEHAPVDRPDAVLAWLRQGLAAGGTPYLHTLPGAALRVCEAALRAGVDLHGVELALGGEPLTAARADVLRRTGARVLPRYAAVEVGLVGDACLAPAGPDDVHVLHDLVAVLQPGAETPGGAALLPDTLLVTSLRPTAPLVLLNASMGDVGGLAPAACGCPLAELGWTTRLRGIRSYEKLTAEGMTFHDVDVIRVLEEALPGRFGGGPADYQLIEDEDGAGRPRLRLLVASAVGPVDSPAVAEAFLAAVGAASPAAGLMSQVWRTAGLLTVERRAPTPTGAGKILHLHRAPRPERGWPSPGARA